MNYKCAEKNKNFNRFSVKVAKAIVDGDGDYAELKQVETPRIHSRGIFEIAEYGG